MTNQNNYVVVDINKNIIISKEASCESCWNYVVAKSKKSTYALHYYTVKESWVAKYDIKYGIK